MMAFHALYAWILFRVAGVHLVYTGAVLSGTPCVATLAKLSRHQPHAALTLPCVPFGVLTCTAISTVMPLFPAWLVAVPGAVELALSGWVMERGHGGGVHRHSTAPCLTACDHAQRRAL